MPEGRRRAARWPLLALLLLARAGGAATVEDVDLFVGADDARVLLRADGPIEAAGVRSEPPLGRAPARAVVRIPGATLGTGLLEAHGAGQGRVELRVDDRGVRRVALAQLPGGLQVVVETERARRVAVTPLAGRALLLALQAPGSQPDPSLPDAAILTSIVEGRSLRARDRARGVASPRIVLDPGHGGWDRGAVGPSGQAEADLALRLARRAARELEERLGAEVVLTRDADVFVALEERAALANAVEADLFVSIHCNAATVPTLRGVETYYLDLASDAGAARVAARENREARGAREPLDPLLADLRVAGVHRRSRDLAVEVQRATVAALREAFGEDLVRDLGVHTAVFAVLVEARMPAVLLESGFVSHPEEELRLRHPRYEEAVAEGLADAIARFLAERP